ncbi:hypothetical protein D3C71_1615570 [compost metagenome]
MLHGHQHGAAQFSAKRQALADPQRHKQDRRPHADLRVGGQQADEHRTDAHHEQAEGQHGLASDAVAEMAEENSTDGAGEHAAGKSSEGGQCAGQWIELRKEQLVEHQRGGGAIGQEIECLYSRAHHRGYGDPKQIRLVGGRRNGVRIGGCVHVVSLGIVLQVPLARGA